MHHSILVRKVTKKKKRNGNSCGCDLIQPPAQNARPCSLMMTWDEALKRNKNMWGHVLPMEHTPQYKSCNATSRRLPVEFQLSNVFLFYFAALYLYIFLSQLTPFCLCYLSGTSLLLLGTAPYLCPGYNCVLFAVSRSARSPRQCECFTWTYWGTCTEKDLLTGVGATWTVAFRLPEHTVFQTLGRWCRNLRGCISQFLWDFGRLSPHNLPKLQLDVFSA